VAEDLTPLLDTRMEQSVGCVAPHVEMDVLTRNLRVGICLDGFHKKRRVNTSKIDMLTRNLRVGFCLDGFL